ncbi:MAG: YvcK family protein [Candidatus Caldatribacteriota bacterium]
MNKVKNKNLLWRWLSPGIRIKRYIFSIILGIFLLIVGWFCCFNENFFIYIKDNLKILFQHSHQLMIILGIFLELAALGMIVWGIKNLNRSIVQTIAPRYADRISQLVYTKHILSKGPRIVSIGGGTGLYALLRGLKKITNNITAVVTVFDSGGSSGKLRKELGVLPPGDIRNCLVALATDEPLMEQLFQYRFSNGSLEGHSFGNLFITAMSEVSGDFVKAIEKSSEILSIRGKVLPSSLQNVTLIARTQEGIIIRGENEITQSNMRIKRIYLEPESVLPLPETLEAIQQADLIILGPGSLYTSVICNLLVKGIPEAIINSKALKVYICNLMTQRGETNNYSASRHLKEVERYLGKDSIDYLIVNTARISKELKEKYAQEGSSQVIIDKEEIKRLKVRWIEKDLWLDHQFARHDSDLLAEVINDLLIKEKK